jgi:shikimate kinase
MVFMLGYPGFGKRTVGSHLADLLDAVLVDNSLIHIPLLTLFKSDGKEAIPMEIWDRVKPIRAAVLSTIEDLAPPTNSYVFTNVVIDDEDGAHEYDQLRALADRRGSLFLAVMLECEVDEQVRRIDTPDRRLRLKGSDPEGYRLHRQHIKLFQPPVEELFRVDTTQTPPGSNAQIIYEELIKRGLKPVGSATR